MSEGRIKIYPKAREGEGRTEPTFQAAGAGSAGLHRGTAEGTGEAGKTDVCFLDYQEARILRILRKWNDS